MEIDPSLGEPLRDRLAGTNVDVIVADATDAGLPDNRFSAAACFSVLHHMPSPEDQDRLFSELHRVLRPGGIFVGQDSLDLESMRAAHADDTFTPVDPDGDERAPRSRRLRRDEDRHRRLPFSICQREPA